MPGEVVDVVDREFLGCRLLEVSEEEAGRRGTARVGGARVGGGHHSQQEGLWM